VGAVCLVLLPNAFATAARASMHAAACAGGATARMVCYHERTRRRFGLVRLRRNPELDRAARLKAQRIIRCRRFAHSPCGEPFDRALFQAGYLPWRNGWTVGENLAYGWSAPYGAFQGLMRSPPHRANILRGAFREIGVFETASPWGPLWVVEYGRHW
jgi:uncharacterized protein YkwD